MKEPSELKGKSFSLRIREVTQYQLDILKRSRREHVKVDQGHWEEVDDEGSIENQGAAPCLIIYAKNIHTDSTISGHFGMVDRDKIRNSTKKWVQTVENSYHVDDKADTLTLPTPEQIRQLNITAYDSGHERYLKMLERLSEWIEANGSENIEIYLFGQNFPISDSLEEDKKVSRMTEIIKEHHGVISQLNEIGIPSAKIVDTRKLGIDRTEDTFYIPENKTIYHSIRD